MQGNTVGVKFLIILLKQSSPVMHSAGTSGSAGRAVTVLSPVCFILVETWFSKGIELVMKEVSTVNK